MIQRLRRIHRYAMTSFGVLLPAALISGLVVRRSLPQENLGFLRSSSANSQLSQLVRPYKGLPSPDTLVYWSPAASEGEALPSEVIFLGALHVDQISGDSLPSNGYLIFYSLAHQRVVAQLARTNMGIQP